MITERVNRDLEAILPLSVQSVAGDDHLVEVVLDTGFNGFLTLPLDLVERLKLPWLFRQLCELADGSLQIVDVHAGTIVWHGQPRAIEVEVAETAPLLGMATLSRYTIAIDVIDGGRVEISSLS